MARSDKVIERPRAYYQGELVTVIEKGKLKSTIRTAHGFLIESVRNKELDFKVDEEQATLRYEAPTS